MPSALDPSASAYELEFHEHENGRGYVLVRRSDGQRLRWDLLLPSEGLISLNVVGATFHAAALRDPSFKPGLPLRLRREPENPYGSNATSVWNADESLKAGYIAHDEAAWLAPRLDGGEVFAVLAMWEMLEAGHRVHLRILLLNEAAVAGGVNIRAADQPKVRSAKKQTSAIALILAIVIFGFLLLAALLAQ